MLLRLPTFCSASGMFAQAHTDSFLAIIRKKTASILRRVRNSRNSIVRTMTERLASPIMQILVRKTMSAEQFAWNSVVKKEKTAAKLWPQTWGFYSKVQEIQEEEAQKIGMTVEQYRAAVQSHSSQPEPHKYPVTVDPSPKPLPLTSSGMIGRRAMCPLERYGRLVKTDRDYPTRPPLRPGQIYDPYKQTIVFLGSVEGDPISYKLPPSRCEVTDEMWARPQQLTVSPLCWDNLQKVMRESEQLQSVI